MSKICCGISAFAASYSSSERQDADICGRTCRWRDDCNKNGQRLTECLLGGWRCMVILSTNSESLTSRLPNLEKTSHIMFGEFTRLDPRWNWVNAWFNIFIARGLDKIFYADSGSSSRSGNENGTAISTRQRAIWHGKFATIRTRLSCGDTPACGIAFTIRNRDVAYLPERLPHRNIFCHNQKLPLAKAETTEC